VGKAGGPNHLERSVRIIPGVLQRLGLPETEVQTVLLLVREHLAMSTLAQLRDIHDPKILRRFAQSVGNAEHLTMLYLLTYADMKAVGPGIWNSWKGSLLEELYSRTLDLIIPGGDEQEEDFLERLIAEVSARVAGRPTAELIDDYFQHMPERSFSWLNPSRVVRHLKALLGLTRTRQVSVGISEEPALGALELVVATHDRSGVLWQIAGACATVGVNILGAQVFTRTDGVALDTLQIEPPPQDPDTGMPVMPLVDIETELADKLTAMLTGGSGEPEVAGRDDSGSERQMEMSRRVPVRVKGDNRESQTHSLIQIEALDRLGLLYDVTRTISQSGVNIHLAKINTEANKVIDAFYVNRDGGKLSDAELKALCDKIESAIKAKQ